MKVSTRIHRALVMLCASVIVSISGITQLPAPVFASPSPSDQSLSTPDLWVVDDMHLARLPIEGGSADPQVVTNVDLPSAIVGDALDSLVWIYQKGQLVALDQQGRSVSQIDLSSEVTESATVGHVSLLVDAMHRQLWLGLDKTLLHLDFSGRIQGKIQLDQPIQALALDPLHPEVWVASGEKLKAFGASGTPSRELAFQQPITAIAFDPSTDALWAAAGKAVHRLAQNSSSLDVPVEGFIPSYLAPDGSGGIWLAGGASAEHLDSQGFVLVQSQMPAFEADAEGKFTDAVIGLVADTLSGNAWIVGHHQVLRLGMDGLVHPWFDARQWPQLHSILLVAPELTYTAAIAKPGSTNASVSVTPAHASSGKNPVPRSVPSASQPLPATASTPQPACVAPNATDCTTATNVAEHIARMLWVSKQRDLYKVVPETRGANELAALQSEEALAVDNLHDVVWVYGKHTLVAFDATGKQLIDTTLPKHIHGDDHADLIVDGASGVEWLASGSQLYRFDQTGQWQATYPLHHATQAIALDAKRHRLWVAEGEELVALDSTGKKIVTESLAHQVDALVYDASLDQLWLTMQGRLMRLASDGSTVLTAKLDRHSVDAIAGDGAGGAWATSGHMLSHFDNAGVEQFALQPLSKSAPKKLANPGENDSELESVLDHLSNWWHDDGDAQHIVGMAADPSTHGVWVAGHRHLALIDLSASRTQWIDSRTWKANDSPGSGSDDRDGSDGRQKGIQGLALYVDTTPPVLTLISPVTGAYTNKSRPTLSLHYTDTGSGVDPNTVEVKSDGTVIPVSCQPIVDGAQCTPNANILDGTHALSVVVKDYAGNASVPAIATVTVDTVPPTIALTSPTTQLTNQPAQNLVGSLSEKAALTVNNANVPLNAALQFEWPITLKQGSNVYTLTATDLAGNTAARTVAITLDTTPPALPVLGLLSVTGPINGQVTISGKTGSVEGGATVVLTDTVTGATVSVVAAADGSFTALLTASASDPISVWVMDGAGNVTKSPTPIQASQLPPDPATVAPKLLSTVATPFQDQVGFLYSGPQPIQTGVAPGAIAPLHVAVVRGQVFDRTSHPLPGVTVTVLDHPEWGHTLTRADGRYDMAVNGGGSLVLNFSASGYLAAQRTVDVTWHDFTVADPLVMVVPDAIATPVAFGAGNVQVAQSSLQSGNTGARQTTVLIPAGTMATAVMPDGRTLAISTAHLRATEFTVGSNGPSAMPANLPATSAYTYAVNLSLDEAKAAGATSVQFSKPVPVYVSNYMNISAGTRVPAGYYDPQAGAWKGALDGVVVKVLGIDTAGLAQLDLDGSGPASATLLGQYGIDAAELATIAKSFAVGQSFWRVPVNHFTDWDFNFGYNPQAGYLLPPPPQPKPNSTVPQRDSRDDHVCSGCEIDAENQRVGETIPVVGTPYTLHYESSSPASMDTRTITFPVTTATPPAGTLLSSIQVTVDIAGRTVVENFDPTIPNQTFRWTWDGINAYGQPLHSPTQATIYLAYVYKQSYGAFIDSTPGAGQHFAMPGNAPMTGYAHAGDTVASTRRWTEKLTPGGASPLGADRWSLNVTHGYDSNRHILYKGDGTIRSAQDYGDAGKATSFAGQGGNNIGATGNGGPATQATLWDPAIVKAAPDGNVYIWDSAEYCIRRVDAQGTISTFGGICGRAANGQVFSSLPIAATSVALRFDNMSVGPDDSLYVNVQDGIARITPDGMGTLIAGGGSQPLVDGQPSAGTYVHGMFVVAPDKTIYFANDNYHYGAEGLWKVDAAGVLHFVLGGGFDYGIRGLALAKNGDVVFGDATALLGEIKELTPQGKLIKLAGYGPGGGPRVSPEPTLGLGTYIPETNGLVSGPDGSLYQMGDGGQIVRLDPQGWVRCVVGCSNVRYSGNAPFPEGGLPAQSVLDHTCCQFNSFDIGPDGSIYLPELYDARVLRVAPVLPQVSLGNSLVASRSGRQVYVFNESGQHLETLDAITGNPIYTFLYDASGLLSSLTDAEGRVTTIKRDSQGQPTAIMAPDGQTTVLAVDAQQHLTAVADPAGNTYAMAYDSPGGQLTQFNNPRGFSDQYTYDANGLLVTNINAGGGGWTLTRTGATDQSAPYTVSMQSGMGRTYSYAVSTQSDGSNLDLATAPDGTQSSLLTTQGGQRTTTAADGTVATVLQSADPRFGMQAPVDSSTTIKTPSGLTWSASQTRSAPLQTPTNLLSFTSLQETSTINGNKTTRQYDPQIRTWTTTLPSGRTVATAVDNLDRPVSVSVPGMAKVSLTYDSAGRPLSVSASDGTATRAMSYVYYPGGPQKGWLQSATDPLGRTVSYQYDAAGRITTKVLPDGRQIGFGYDADGNLTSITPPGRPAHGFAHTPLDKTASYTPPLVSGMSTSTTQYQYNKDRQLTQIALPDGAHLDFGYDAGGRPESLVTPSGSYQYSYDSKSGKLTSILAPGNEALGFTWNGFLQTGVSWSGTVNGSVSRTYDNNFRVSGIAVNGQNIAYAYDADGLLTAAGGLAVSHDPGNGHVTGTTMGPVQTALSYNGFGDVMQLQASNGGSALYDVAYQRDALGRIARQVQTTMGVTQTLDYAYDTQGRLTDVKLNGLDEGAYGYDANGNRTQIGGQTVASYDDQDRLLTWGSNTYSYDANGALASKTTSAGTTQYTYDELGNLREVKVPGGSDIQYVIDGQNRRIGKKVNGVLVQGLLYQEALKPVAELDGQGNIVSRFVYGTRVNVPDYMIKGGNTYRIIKDLLGSPRLVVDAATGQVVQAMDYDAWGRVTQDTNPGFQPFGFAGGLYDRDTGLIRFGARDYDPETGRWTAKDPLGFGGGDADLYAYVGNSPLMYADPNGRELGLAVIGAIAGGTFGLVQGLIAGHTRGELLADVGAGVVFGGLAGLTNGVSLIWGAPLRAAAGAAIEAGKQKLVDGCVHDYVSVGLAAGGSALGDATEFASAGALRGVVSETAEKYGAASLGDVFGGALPLPAAPSSTDR